VWRSIFLALGIVLCILGAECLVLEKAVWAQDKPPVQQSASLFISSAAPASNEFVPPESAPWTLLTLGVVVILYSCSLRRNNG